MVPTDEPALAPARLRRLPVLDVGGGLLVAVATTASARTLGLAGLAGLPQGWGLLIPRCQSVHTFGMRFALDVLFLDSRGGLIDVREGVVPVRVTGCRAAAAVLEVNAGAGRRYARQNPLPCPAQTFL